MTYLLEHINTDDINCEKYYNFLNSGVHQTFFWKEVSKIKKEKIWICRAVNNQNKEETNILGTFTKELFGLKNLRVTDLKLPENGPILFLHNFLDMINSQNFINVEITFSKNSTYFSQEQIKKINIQNFKNKKLTTLFVSLNESKEEIFSRFSSSTKKKIKRNKAKFKAEKIDGPTFYKIYKKMESLNGRIFNLSDNLIEKFWQIEKPFYNYYVLIDENKTHLACLGMYNLNGVSTEIASSMNPHCFQAKIPAQHILHWYLFLEAKRMGMNTFDLANVELYPRTKKEEGIKQFKSSFGGIAKDYNMLYKQHKILNSLVLLKKNVKKVF